jgi:hypothetical protein
MPTQNDAMGYPQAVRPNGFSLNYCASMEMAAHAGDEGQTYSALCTADPGAAGTCDFFYMKNTTDTIMRIYKIKAAPPTVSIEVSITVGVTGSPTSGSNVTPVNALVGSGSIVAEGDVQQRDGDMALTGGSVFDVLFLDKDFVGEMVWNYPGEIALMKNQALVFNNDIDPTSDIDMTVYFYFHEAIKKP